MELWFTESHTPNVKFSIRVDRQLYSSQSEFQRIDVFESPEFGRILVLDGYLMMTEKDEFIYHEMITHVPMAVHPNVKSVLVIGLGRFGGSVAATLDQMGQDVLAVDKNPELVARWSAHLPTIQADMTDVLAIEQIDASQFDTAVVAIGDSIEASVIITGNLLDAGVSDLWAKSVSQEHARILQRIGARHIINAETDAGKRVGHLVAGNYLDYIEIDGPYTVVKVHTPLYAVGRSIEDVQVHDKYGVTVVGLKAPGKEFQYGSKELVMHRNDELILMGKQDQIDHFIQG